MSRTRSLAAVLISSALLVAPMNAAGAATTPAAKTTAQPFKLSQKQINDIASACTTASKCNAFIKAFMQAIYNANVGTPGFNSVNTYFAVGVAMAAAYNANPNLSVQFANAFDRLSRAGTVETGIPAFFTAYANAARAGKEIEFTATASAVGQTPLNNPGSPA